MKYEDIVALNAITAIEIFGKDEKSVKKAISELIKNWHPDVCQHAKSAEVMSKLITLRNAVTSVFSGKTVTNRPQRVFETDDGKIFGTRPLNSFRDEISEIIVGNSSLMRVFDADNADLAGRFVKSVEAFRYADNRMEKEFKRFLPDIHKMMTLKTGQPVHVFERRRDMLPLSDLMRSQGPIDPKSFAWIISGLLNILCWADWSGIVHGSLTPENITVSPEFHETHLIFGWEFAHSSGAQPEVLPNRTLSSVPSLMGQGVKMDNKVDVALLKILAQDMAGFSSVNALLSSGVPAPIKDWIMSASEETPVNEYAAWKKALQLSYGNPKFIHMNTTPEEIYEV